MPFVEQVNALWKESRLTLAQLAELCDISESSASRYINGRVNPPADVAERIMEVLNESKPRQREPEPVKEAPREPVRETITIRQLHEVYEAQIADLRRDKQILFITLLVLTALLVYIFIDALHGNWGIIQYPI